MKNYLMSKTEWEKALVELLKEYDIVAPLSGEKYSDYSVIDPSNISQVTYNASKPVTPLKSLFLPVRENVSVPTSQKPRIILGVPSCDLAALNILDEIYLDPEWPDPFYQDKRNRTLLIATDCYQPQDHCHCTACNINPFPEENHDLSLSLIDDRIYLTSYSEKGSGFMAKINADGVLEEKSDEIPDEILMWRTAIVNELNKRNEKLPALAQAGEFIVTSDETIWNRYGKDCVSCGACAAICPTCTCFLLVDRPEFVKIKQMDTCQYPGFARVAAGEDPLQKKVTRFKNRYMCKYVWKPDKFRSTACTGCGRCIETCIGMINKNELLVEISN